MEVSVGGVTRTVGDFPREALTGLLWAAPDAAAGTRARDLLRSFLTPGQRDTYSRHGYVQVSGDRYTYRLFLAGPTYRRKGRPPMNADPGCVGADGGPEWRYGCVVSAGGWSFPEGDMLLARLLAIRNDEDAFLETVCW